MSFFNDDKDKDSFFSPVSFNSATDSSSSWAFDTGNKKSESTFYSTSSSSGGFDPFESVNNNTETQSNFFSSPNDAKNSAFGGGSNWGTPGYNSHSKDHDIFSLNQHLNDDSRFGHWTPQNSFLRAENAKSNLEDKDWGSRYESNWAFEPSKEKTSWAYSTSDNSESDWAFKVPSTNSSSNWAFSSNSNESSSNWAYSQPSLNRWGFDSGAKESNSDDFNPFKKK